MEEEIAPTTTLFTNGVNTTLHFNQKTAKKIEPLITKIPLLWPE
jgi:hypothetical protein